MKNIRSLTLALLLTLFGSSYALAEFTVGVSGGIALIEASGTETEGGEKNSKDISHVTPMASIFVEYNNVMETGLSVGLDYIPYSDDFSDKTKKRTDAEDSVTGTATETYTTRNQSAQAELDQHFTLYGTYPVGPMYIKAGYVQVDLNTTENLETGDKYGNETVNGVLMGLGFENEISDGLVGRLELSHTNYDDVTFTSSTTRPGVALKNTIDADLDVTQVKASVGYKF